VLCDQPTKVSMVDHVSDKESALSELSIASTSPSFLGWDATTSEIEVMFVFDELRGCLLG